MIDPTLHILNWLFFDMILLLILLHKIFTVENKAHFKLLVNFFDLNESPCQFVTSACVRCLDICCLSSFSLKLHVPCLLSISLEIGVCWRRLVIVYLINVAGVGVNLVKYSLDAGHK